MRTRSRRRRGGGDPDDDSRRRVDLNNPTGKYMRGDMEGPGRAAVNRTQNSNVLSLTAGRRRRRRTSKKSRRRRRKH